MMIYRIIVNDTPENLSDEVNAVVQDGWKPIGGVAVVRWEVENERTGYMESFWEYSQAMIREEE